MSLYHDFQRWRHWLKKWWIKLCNAELVYPKNQTCLNLNNYETITLKVGKQKLLKWKTAFKCFVDCCVMTVYFCTLKMSHLFIYNMLKDFLALIWVSWIFALSQKEKVLWKVLKFIIVFECLELSYQMNNCEYRKNHRLLWKIYLICLINFRKKNKGNNIGGIF